MRKWFHTDRWKLPVLKRRYRAVLYSTAVVSSVLSVIQVQLNLFSYFINTLAGVLLFGSCFYIVPDFRNAKRFFQKCILPFFDNYRLPHLLLRDFWYRTTAITGTGLFINFAFSVFNGTIGIRNDSPWYVTLSVYYLFLGIMRFWVLNYRRYQAGEKNLEYKKQKEILVYIHCSISMILLTIILGGMVILTVHSVGKWNYPGYTIYAAALYTFIKVPYAVKNWLGASKTREPLLLCIRSITSADAWVSVLSLQTAMLYAFYDLEEKTYVFYMNILTGAVVCIMVLGTGIYGAYCGGKMKKTMEKRREKND